jgi:hypothetical protein
MMRAAIRTENENWAKDLIDRYSDETDPDNRWVSDYAKNAGTLLFPELKQAMQDNRLHVVLSVLKMLTDLHDKTGNPKDFRDLWHMAKPDIDELFESRKSIGNSLDAALDLVATTLTYSLVTAESEKLNLPRTKMDPDSYKRMNGKLVGVFLSSPQEWLDIDAHSIKTLKECLFCKQGLTFEHALKAEYGFDVLRRALGPNLPDSLQQFLVEYKIAEMLRDAFSTAGGQKNMVVVARQNAGPTIT